MSELGINVKDPCPKYLKKKNPKSNKYTLEFKNTNPFNIRTQTIVKKDKNKMTKARKGRKIEMEYLGYTKRGTAILANILYDKNYYIVSERDSIGKFVLMTIQMDSVQIKSINGDMITVKKRNI